MHSKEVANRRYTVNSSEINTRTTRLRYTIINACKLCNWRIPSQSWQALRIVCPFRTTRKFLLSSICPTLFLSAAIKTLIKIGIRLIIRWTRLFPGEKLGGKKIPRIESSLRVGAARRRTKSETFYFPSIDRDHCRQDGTLHWSHRYTAQSRLPTQVRPLSPRRRFLTVSCTSMKSMPFHGHRATISVSSGYCRL